ncbi:MAG: DNA replication/repair protein RecF [Lachnospiraceae bacterium]|nr:DNA replication/repair protein RecF [Lachnospiraceae bacterium]MDY5741867.1 DNA replication/repair protein RecF [Lachnospiraceae bacterium]
MYITNIELQDFRNYEKLSLTPDRQVNIFHGNNAQGKTNLLEAMYICGTTKSHRGSKDKEMIAFEKEESHIRIHVQKEHMPYRIDIHLKKTGKKVISVNQVPIKKYSELFGIVNFVFFSPEDLAMIKNGPQVRRQFMDMELSQIQRLYLSYLACYQKILQDRNRVLKEQPRDMNLLLDVLDEQLVKYGSYIIEKRTEFISELKNIGQNIHNTLSGGLEKLDLCYEQNVTVEDFLTALQQNREKDKLLKNTSVGPHKDDVVFVINGNNVRKYGSQGQQRTVALTLKLSEIRLMKEKTGENPILLLDDVLSELDQHRQQFLLTSIGQTQTFITCTGMEEFIRQIMCEYRIFEVNTGTVYERTVTLHE